VYVNEIVDVGVDLVNCLIILVIESLA